LILSLVLATLLILSSSDAKTSGYKRKVTIEWKKVKGAKEYQMEWVSSETGCYSISESTKKRRVSSPDPDWKGSLPPGRYCFRIRASGNNERIGKWSGFREVEIVPKSPPELNRDKSGVLSWRTVSKAESYILTYRRADGTVLRREQVKENMVPFPREFLADKDLAKNGVEVTVQTYMEGLPPSNPKANNINSAEVRRLGKVYGVKVIDEEEEIRQIEAQKEQNKNKLNRESNREIAEYRRAKKEGIDFSVFGAGLYKAASNVDNALPGYRLGFDALERNWIGFGVSTDLSPGENAGQNTRFEGSVYLRWLDFISKNSSLSFGLGYLYQTRILEEKKFIVSGDYKFLGQGQDVISYKGAMLSLRPRIKIGDRSTLSGLIYTGFFPLTSYFNDGSGESVEGWEVGVSLEHGYRLSKYIETTLKGSIRSIQLIHGNGVETSEKLSEYDGSIGVRYHFSPEQVDRSLASTSTYRISNARGFIRFTIAPLFRQISTRQTTDTLEFDSDANGETDTAVARVGHGENSQISFLGAVDIGIRPFKFVNWGIGAKISKYGLSEDFEGNDINPYLFYVRDLFSGYGPSILAFAGANLKSDSILDRDSAIRKITQTGVSAGLRLRQGITRQTYGQVSGSVYQAMSTELDGGGKSNTNGSSWKFGGDFGYKLSNSFSAEIGYGHYSGHYSGDGLPNSSLGINFIENQIKIGIESNW